MPTILRFLMIVPFLGTLALANPNHEHHDDAELNFKPAYRALATGTLEAWGKRQRYPWPVRVLSIGHTIASYQYYGGSRAYFHHGLDIRAESGSDVIASAGGRVVNIENYVPGNSAYWEVAILDAVGFIWQYHHIRKDSIPQNVWDAFQNGGSIPQGTKIGEVYHWSVTSFGERFHHVHLNILGAGKVYQNPFYFLEPLRDDSPPVVKAIGLRKSGKIVKSSVVSGDYQLVAKVEDLVAHDKFLVPPYLIWYSIDGGPKKTVWEFTRLPGGASETDFVHDFYVRENTCGNYSCRQFTVNLNFGRKRAMPSQPGRYGIEVGVRDFAGNTSTKTFRWQVD